MYKVTSGGEVIGYSDSVVFIRLHGNGCYVPCDVAEATGIVVGGAVYNLPGEDIGAAETAAYTKVDGGTYIFTQQAQLAATEDAACALDAEYDTRLGAVEDVLCEMDTANT